MEESTTNEIIKSTTEIVKTAYEDAFQPVAKETGKALGTLGKTVNVALSPLKAVVWGYDQIEAFIHKSVSEKLNSKGVTEDQIVTPDPDIAVPAVEALRYSKLKDEFANLLASAMNKATLDKAHPSFAEALKQMSLLDAKIIKAIEPGKSYPILQIKHKNTQKPGSKTLATIYGGALAKLQLENFEKFPVAIDNLVRLGLVEKNFMQWLADDLAYNEVRNLPISKQLKLRSIPQHYKYEEGKGIYMLSSYGSDFRQICI